MGDTMIVLIVAVLVVAFVLVLGTVMRWVAAEVAKDPSLADDPEVRRIVRFTKRRPR